MPTSADWDGLRGLQGLRLPPPCGVDTPLAGPRNCECERASEIRRQKLDGRLRKKETLQMKKNTVEEQEERGEETIVRGMLCGTVQMCGDF